MGVETSEAAEIAGRFLTARRAGGSLPGFPGSLPESVGDAYRIQDEAIADWARPVLGWKVGRIPPAHEEALGAERLAGPIFDIFHADGTAPTDMPVFAGGFAAGEAEFLLRIGRAPPHGQSHFSLNESADLIDAVHVGIEIASSPLATINVVGPLAVISDFGNNNGLLVGPAVADWKDQAVDDWTVSTVIDGRVAGQGKASAFPDGVLGSARFLFELMAKRGIALSPGQWISSGAIGGVFEAPIGAVVEARFADRLQLSCRLTAAQPTVAER